jgi:hypothetical protein
MIARTEDVGIAYRNLGGKNKGKITFRRVISYGWTILKHILTKQGFENVG